MSFDIKCAAICVSKLLKLLYIFWNKLTQKVCFYKCELIFRRGSSVVIAMLNQIASYLMVESNQKMCCLKCE